MHHQDSAHDRVPEQAFGDERDARYGGGFFAQADAAQAQKMQQRRGFIGSAAAARADEAAWHQQLARKDGEQIATQRKHGRVW